MPTSCPRRVCPWGSRSTKWPQVWTTSIRKGPTLPWYESISLKLRGRPTRPKITFSRRKMRMVMTRSAIIKTTRRSIRALSTRSRSAMARRPPRAWSYESLRSLLLSLTITTTSVTIHNLITCRKSRLRRLKHLEFTMVTMISFRSSINKSKTWTISPLGTFIPKNRSRGPPNTLLSPIWRISNQL